MELISFRKTNTSCDGDLVDLENGDYILIENMHRKGKCSFSFLDPNININIKNSKVQRDFTSPKDSIKCDEQFNMTDSVEKKMYDEDSDTQVMHNKFAKSIPKKDKMGRDKLINYLMTRGINITKSTEPSKVLKPKVSQPLNSSLSNSSFKENIPTK